MRMAKLLQKFLFQMWEGAQWSHDYTNLSDFDFFAERQNYSGSSQLSGQRAVIFWVWPATHLGLCFPSVYTTVYRLVCICFNSPYVLYNV